MNRSAADSTSISHPHDQLIRMISGWMMPLGYQIVHLELQFHHQKVLRIYIDYLDASSDKVISIEDCVKVSKTLDELLDQAPEIQSLLPSTYELEVSSPGVDRPLRTEQDFLRFSGHLVRIHVYRPLTSDELDNAAYQAKNPKQKNFVGALAGLQQDKIVLLVSFPVSHSVSKSNKDKNSHKPGKKSMAKKIRLTTNSEEGTRVTIPLPLISKANLEPHFDFEGSNEREIEL